VVRQERKEIKKEGERGGKNAGNSRSQKEIPGKAPTFSRPIWKGESKREQSAFLENYRGLRRDVEKKNTPK